MPDADTLDPPDPDARYVETCRRLNVEPVPRDRAGELMAEWAAVFERGGGPLH